MQINTLYEKQFHLLRDKSQQRDEVDVLYYELVHNLVLELTRVGIESRNLKMRLESLSSRMDFDERRARALEGVVQYRAGHGPSRDAQTRASGCHARASSAPRGVARHRIQASESGRLPAECQPETQAGESNTARRRRRAAGAAADAAHARACSAPVGDGVSDGSATPPQATPWRRGARRPRERFRRSGDAGDDGTTPAKRPDPSAQ